MNPSRNNGTKRLLSEKGMGAFVAILIISGIAGVLSLTLAELSTRTNRTTLSHIKDITGKTGAGFAVELLNSLVKDGLVVGRKDPSSERTYWTYEAPSAGVNPETWVFRDGCPLRYASHIACDAVAELQVRVCNVLLLLPDELEALYSANPSLPVRCPELVMQVTVLDAVSENFLSVRSSTMVAAR